MHVLHYLVLLSAVNWDSVESKSEDHSLRSKIVFFIKTVTVLYIFFREFEEVNKRTFSLQENLLQLCYLTDQNFWFLFSASFSPQKIYLKVNKFE